MVDGVEMCMQCYKYTVKLGAIVGNSAAVAGHAEGVVAGESAKLAQQRLGQECAAKVAAEESAERAKLAQQQLEQKRVAKVAAEAKAERAKLAQQQLEQECAAKVAAEESAERAKLAKQQLEQKRVAKVAAEAEAERAKLAQQKLEQECAAGVAAVESAERAKLAQQQLQHEREAGAVAEGASNPAAVADVDSPAITLMKIGVSWGFPTEVIQYVLVQDGSQDATLDSLMLQCAERKEFLGKDPGKIAEPSHSEGAPRRSPRVPQQRLDADILWYACVMRDLGDRGYRPLVCSIYDYIKGFQKGGVFKGVGLSKTLHDAGMMAELLGLGRTLCTITGKVYRRCREAQGKREAKGTIVTVDVEDLEVAHGNVDRLKYGVVWERPRHWQPPCYVGGGKYELTDVSRDGSCCIAVMYLLGKSQGRY